MKQESLNGLISEILRIFISRYEKKNKENNGPNNDKNNDKSRDKSSLILEPLARILNGYSMSKNTSSSNDGKV